MTIWLLGLLLMASLAGLGYRQGGIRVSFSLIGIFFGVLLAGPLAKLIKPLLMAVGVKNPMLLWLLGPFIGFVLVSVLFKIAALAVHQKVDVHYKYKAGDLRLALWERLNQRLGLCLGIVNGAVYFILICFVFYSLSYWTVQVTTSENDPRMVRLCNRLGRDLQSSGFLRAARAIDPLKEDYYDVADLAGIIYNNPLAEARLSRYPAFLALEERPEFQDLANDTEFSNMRMRRDPIMTLLNYPKAQAIINNPELLKAIGSALIPNVKDLAAYVETGRSEKYESEPILGRWNFDVNSAMALLRRLMPNIGSPDMQKRKRFIAGAFRKTSFVAAPDQEAFLKNAPSLNLTAVAPSGEGQTMQGHWKNQAGKYLVTLSTAGKEQEMTASIEGDRLTLSASGVGLTFTRED